MTPTRLALLSLFLLFVACPPQPPAEDVCDPNPCAGDRSVCTVVDGEPSCSCRQGFEDVAGACVMVGPCATNPCTQPNRTVCTASGSTAICQCDQGFRDDGTGACVRAQRCSENPCTQPGRGQCSEAGGVVSCACDPGLRDDGMGGCVSENPCAANPCTQPNRTVCMASGMTAVCQCNAGFIDDGSGACVAAASCTPNPCTQPNRTQCSVSGNTVSCACDPGYRLDAVGQCVAQQACSPNPCTQPNRGVCTEANGVAVCGCNVGFHDEGGVCVPNDPCAPNPCTLPNQAVCTAQVDAGVSCACNPGYQPAAVGCEPIPPPVCSNQHGGDSFEPDECPSLAKPITPGVPQSRTFSPAGDVEFVTFTADAGTVLLAEETTSTATYLTLYDSTGASVLWANQSERLHRKLPTTGAYYLALRAQSASATGSSTLQISLLSDDQPDTRETSTTVLMASDAGTSLAGRFDFVSDTDCVTAPVQAGRIYQFDETSPTDVVMTVYTQTGTYFSATDSESLRFEASVSEPLYFCVRAYTATSTAAWTLRVSDLGVDDQADDRTTTTTLTPTTAPGPTLSGNFQYPFDVDCVAVPVQADRIYVFEEISGTDITQTIYTATGTFIASTDSEGVRFETSTAQTLYLCARAYASANFAPWTLRVTDLGVDDHPDTAATSVTTVTPAATPGAELTGAFQYPFDTDCFTVPVQANRIYAFTETTGTDILQTVYTTSGTFLSSTDSESVRFETSVAQNLFVCVRGYDSSSLASWAMRVIDIGVDDQPDVAAAATAVLTPTTTGATLSGTFDVAFDNDCVQVPVVAGRIYAFSETTGTDILQQLQRPGGASVVASTDSESVRIEATATETLAWCVRGYDSGSLAGWTLSVQDVGVDDHGDDRMSATPLTIDGPAVTGELQLTNDNDYFSFTVAGPIALRVVTTGVSSAVTVQNASGSTVASGTGPNTLTFTVSAAGTYYVRVAPGSLGAYSIAVKN